MAAMLPPLKKPSAKARATVARSLIKACPVCGGGLDLHQSWTLASIVLDGGGSVDELAKLIDAHQWERASRYRGRKGDRDVRVELSVGDDAAFQ